MINKIILLGRIGKDAEVTNHNGRTLCKFSLATTESYKTQGGWQENPTWHNIIIWSEDEHAAHSYKKGDLVYIEGRQEHRSYEDKSGQTKNYSQVVANRTRRISKAGQKAVEPRSVSSDEFDPFRPIPKGEGGLQF